MKNLFICFLLFCAAPGQASLLHAEPVLLGHPGLKDQTLDDAGIKAVLLGKKVVFGDVRVVIVIARTSEAQNAFLQAHVGMTTSQFQNHWRRLFLTGGGIAPKIVATEADACKYVAEAAGAVTAADSTSADTLVILGK